MGYMVSYWWDSVAQPVVVFYWVVEVVFWRGKSDNAMLGKSMLVGCV